MSQVELAERAGISPEILREYEIGALEISDRILQVIAEAQTVHTSHYFEGLQRNVDEKSHGANFE